MNNVNPTTIVHTVTNSNFDQLYPIFDRLLSQASFISVDSEFSGIGSHKTLRLSNIQDRYYNLSKEVKSRSLLEFGVSIFIKSNNIRLDGLNNNNKVNESNENGGTKRKFGDDEEDEIGIPFDTCTEYQVTIFNFLMLNAHDFVVSTNSLSFLSQHGFDFNRLFLEGLKFIPFQTTASKKNIIPPTQHQSKLITSLISHKIPLVVHNGLFDLLFIFQTFIDDLPDQLNQFIIKLTNAFPKIYDTKYISEYIFKENRSYLQYLFLKYERLNYDRMIEQKAYVKCIKRSGIDQSITLPLNQISSRLSKPYDGVTPICDSFSNHGYCKNGVQCKQSHDISIILDQEESKKKSKNSTSTTTTTTASTTTINSPKQTDNSIKKLKSNNNQDKVLDSQDIDSTSTSSTTNNDEEESIDEISYDSGNNSERVGSGSHSAGLDSAMTGYIFAYYLLTCSQTDKLSTLENRVYISGKNVPLLIKKSNYA